MAPSDCLKQNYGQLVHFSWLEVNDAHLDCLKLHLVLRREVLVLAHIDHFEQDVIFGEGKVVVPADFEGEVQVSNQNVCKFDVAVRDASRVKEVEPTEQLPSNYLAVSLTDWSDFDEPFSEVPACDQLMQNVWDS